MEQFERAKVVMLPAKGMLDAYKTPITEVYEDEGKLYLNKKEIGELITELGSPQHLCIISDDEIKENDYCLNLETNTVFKMHKHGLPTGNRNKKIIATTDTSLLKLRTDVPEYWSDSLPQPSQQFIEKYIEEYNKGNVITDVLVEYEQDYTNRNCSTCSLGTDGTCELNLEKKCCSNTNNVTKHGDYWISCLDEEEDSEIYKIKVTPKDSTITIKKLKDSWNREEIIEQMWSAYKAANTVFEDESALRIEFDNWINQNI